MAEKDNMPVVSVSDIRSSDDFESKYETSLSHFKKYPNLYDARGKAFMWMQSRVFSDETLTDDELSEIMDTLLAGSGNSTPYDDEVNKWMKSLGISTTKSSSKSEEAEEQTESEAEMESETESESETETESEDTANVQTVDLSTDYYGLYDEDAQNTKWGEIPDSVNDALLDDFSYGLFPYAASNGYSNKIAVGLAAGAFDIKSFLAMDEDAMVDYAKNYLAEHSDIGDELTPDEIDISADEVYDGLSLYRDALIQKYESSPELFLVPKNVDEQRDGEMLLAKMGLNDLSDENIALLDDYIKADKLSEFYEKIGESSRQATYADVKEQFLTELNHRGISGKVLENFCEARLDELCAAEEKDLGPKGYSIRNLADLNNVSEEVVAYYANMSTSERESDPLMKSVIRGDIKGLGNDGGPRWDTPPSDGSELVLNEGTIYECRIRDNGDGTYHLDGYLTQEGGLDYSPDEFTVCYKEIPGTEGDNPDGSLTKLPVFHYTGPLVHDEEHGAEGAPWYEVPGETLNWIAHGFDEDVLKGGNRHEQVVVPEGLRIGDYLFEGNEEIQLISRFPESMESSHCMYMDCPRLHGASKDAKVGEGFGNSGGHYDISTNMLDMSYTFYNSGLGYTSMGAFPWSVLTTQGMIGQCWNYGKDFDGDIFTDIFYKDAEALDTTASLAMTGEQADAAYVLDGEENITSDEAKIANETNQENLIEAQENMDADALSEEQKEQIERSKGAAAVQNAEDVVAHTVVVKDIEDYSNRLKENELGETVAKWGNMAIGYIGGSIVTGLVMDNDSLFGKIGSKLLPIIPAMMANKFLPPQSVEKILGFVNGFLPESHQGFLNGIIEKIHVPDDADRAAAYEDQKARYAKGELANSLRIAMGNPGLYAGITAGAVSASDLEQTMYLNAQKLGMNGAFEVAGRDSEYEEDARAVGEYVAASTDVAEENLKKMYEEALADKDNPERLADAKRLMKDYYFGLLQGASGYSEGALEGIQQAHGENPEEMSRALYGLGMFTRVYTSEIMDSMLEMNDEYDFLTYEELAELSQQKPIYGVGNLEEYISGGGFTKDGEPVVETPPSDMENDASEQVEDISESSHDTPSEQPKESEGSKPVAEPVSETESDEEAETDGDTKPSSKPTTSKGSDYGERAASQTGFTGDELDSSDTVDLDSLQR